MECLKQFELVYLGTPYSKFPGGIEAGFIAACELTAKLLVAGIKIYSPIAHTHPVAIHGKVDPLDHSIWLPFDRAIMNKSDAMVVAMMPTWYDSYGIAYEVDTFRAADKPVFFLNPETMAVSS